MDNRLSAAIILAGGSTHRSAELPLALLPVLGKPAIGHVLETVEALEPESILIIAADGKAAIEEWAGGRARVIEQPRGAGCGSGYAAGAALERLDAARGGVLISYADRIFLREETLRLLVGARTPDVSASVLSVLLDRPAGHARIVRDEEGKVLRATSDCELVRPGDAAVREVVAGAYCFDIAKLRRAILPPAQVDRKYNLTECIRPLVEAGGRVLATPVGDPREARGIYSEQDARLAEKLLTPQAVLSIGQPACEPACIVAGAAT